MKDWIPAWDLHRKFFFIKNLTEKQACAALSLLQGAGNVFTVGHARLFSNDVSTWVAGHDILGQARPASAFWPLCFGVSLCFNYALVLILTSCGLYARATMLIVCGLEGILFAGLLAARKLSFPRCDARALHGRLVEEFTLRPLFFLGRMLFWGILLFSVYKMIRLVGGVFTGWDAGCLLESVGGCHGL